MSGGPREHLWYETTDKHKATTDEAGPPRIVPGGNRCPEDLGVRDVLALLDASIAADGRANNPSRFAFRRSPGGLEFFETKSSNYYVGAKLCVHGHPVKGGDLPPSVLRQWQRMGLITSAEYRATIKGRKE